MRSIPVMAARLAMRALPRRAAALPVASSLSVLALCACGGYPDVNSVPETPPGLREALLCRLVQDEDACKGKAPPSFEALWPVQDETPPVAGEE